MELVNKITVKIVCGVIAEAMQGKKTLDLMQIVGIANGTGITNGTYGESVFLKGQFKATNLLTKDVFASGKCYLPDAATNLVAGQLNGDNTQVQFAFIIGAKAANNKVGYEYFVKPLIEPSENDPIALIENQIKK